MRKNDTFDFGVSTYVDVSSSAAFKYVCKSINSNPDKDKAEWVCYREAYSTGSIAYANGVDNFSEPHRLIKASEAYLATYPTVDANDTMAAGTMVSPTIGGVPKSEIVVLGLSTGSPILGVRFTLNPGDDVTAGNRLSLNSALDTTLILPDTQSQRFGPFRDSSGEFIPLTYCALVGVQVSSTYTSAQYMLGYNDTDLADAIANMAKCLFSADDKVYELIVTVTSSFVATGSQNAVIVKLEGVSYA